METKVTAVNGHGHLTIGGLDTVALALKYGTPLYVMDEDAIRANCRALKNSMDAHYHKKGHGQRAVPHQAGYRRAYA